MAGSIADNGSSFPALVRSIGLSLVDAATLCSTTPARELGLVGHGVLARRRRLPTSSCWTRTFSVVQTYVGGQLVYSREPAAAARG